MSEPSLEFKAGLKVRHLIRMGQYENVEVTAWVDRAFPLGTPASEVSEVLNKIIDAAVRPTMDEALFTTNDEESYVGHWKKED